MLIGVISDTHDRLPAIDAALRLFEERRAEAILHAGDLIAPFAAQRLLACKVPLHIVYGNNDGERAGLRSILPQIQGGPLRVGLDGKDLLLHHFIEWCDPEEIERSDAVITGHTHEVVNDHDGRRLLLNPGECCGWVNGRCTVALLDSQSLSAEICQLDVP
ncbi:MAG: metallophosphoesterase [Planctomycetota bacterium]|jgi:putative phosphoesterase